MKILKNNIFIFFVLGVIFSIISFAKTSRESIFLLSAFFYFMPFFIAIIMNLLINITEKEIQKEQTTSKKTLKGIKKILEGIMRIINILSIIFFLGCLGFIIIN